MPNVRLFDKIIFKILEQYLTRICPFTRTLPLKHSFIYLIWLFVGWWYIVVKEGLSNNWPLSNFTFTFLSIYLMINAVLWFILLFNKMNRGTASNIRSIHTQFLVFQKVHMHTGINLNNNFEILQDSNLF